MQGTVYAVNVCYIVMVTMFSFAEAAWIRQMWPPSLQADGLMHLLDQSGPPVLLGEGFVRSFSPGDRV